uniref:THAP-type domain-containing protein n=1 Tax=Cyprinus carpio TaxID=7962 RepID=A0A8C1PVL2_CYPCA
MIKMAPKTTRCCSVPSCGKTQSLHCLPSDPNIRKEWMNFIFNVDPDSISKNLVLCSLHFTVDSVTNKSQFDAGFSERLKLKDDAVYNIYYGSHHTVV